VFEIYTGRNGGAYNDESAFHYGFSIATTNNFFRQGGYINIIKVAEGILSWMKSICGWSVGGGAAALWQSLVRTSTVPSFHHAVRHLSDAFCRHYAVV